MSVVSKRYLASDLAHIQIIDEGKLVLVSVSQSEPGLAKVLCTLIKCLFQATVLSRPSVVLSTT